MGVHRSLWAAQNPSLQDPMIEKATAPAPMPEVCNRPSKGALGAFGSHPLEQKRHSKTRTFKNEPKPAFKNETLSHFGGDWDVHWGYGVLTHSHLCFLSVCVLTPYSKEWECGWEEKVAIEAGAASSAQNLKQLRTCMVGNRKAIATSDLPQWHVQTKPPAIWID